MSAFIVSENHIRFVVNSALELGVGIMHPTASPIRVRTPDEIGQMLIDENHRSVTRRYPHHPERNPVPTYVHGRSPRIPSSTPKDIAQIIMAVDCLDYQCCETEDYQDTDTCKFLRSIKEAAVRCLTYDTFPNLKWSIE